MKVKERCLFNIWERLRKPYFSSKIRVVGQGKSVCLAGHYLRGLDPRLGKQAA